MTVVVRRLFDLETSEILFFKFGQTFGNFSIFSGHVYHFIFLLMRKRKKDRALKRKGVTYFWDFVGISFFFGEFCWEFVHFKIPKTPNIFRNSTKIPKNFSKSLVLLQHHAPPPPRSSSAAAAAVASAAASITSSTSTTHVTFLIGSEKFWTVLLFFDWLYSIFK